MNYLVDTHIFLWSILSPKKISKRAHGVLLDPEHAIAVSTITFWEISLKYQLGKLELNHILPDVLPTIAAEAGFEILDLTAATAASFYKLPKLKNKDPFDRLLAWQAIYQGFSLISKDADSSSYKTYGLKVVW